jgi:hypothetical protein
MEDVPARELDGALHVFLADAAHVRVLSKLNSRRCWESAEERNQKQGYNLFLPLLKVCQILVIGGNIRNNLSDLRDARDQRAEHVKPGEGGLGGEGIKGY